MKLDENIDSDLSENEEQYNNLAKAVSQLDSTQRVKAATRKELSTVVSEFHLPGGTAKARNLIDVDDLTKSLRKKKAYSDISKKVKSITSKVRTLPKPLEKPVAERIQRTEGYKNVTSHLKKWNAVVEKNRVADQLSFPLQQGRVTLQTSQQFFGKFKNNTPLENEIYSMLNGEKGEEMETEETEEQREFPMTLEEIMEKRKEMAQFRAKMSYREAKAFRQSKIKSKKYHRILKREKIKQQLKDFEQLQKTNPEAALKKLEEIDRSRAQERASLRHKNTGKWAKNVAVRAKYDKESRKVLAEQLKMSRDLTEKVKNIGDEDNGSDQEHDEKHQRGDIFTTSDNPWAIRPSSEVSNFVSGFKKYWEDVKKNKESEKGFGDRDDGKESEKNPPSSVSNEVDPDDEDPRTSEGVEQSETVRENCDESNGEDGKATDVDPHVRLTNSTSEISLKNDINNVKEGNEEQGNDKTAKKLKGSSKLTKKSSTATTPGTRSSDKSGSAAVDDSRGRASSIPEKSVPLENGHFRGSVNSSEKAVSKKGEKSVASKMKKKKKQKGQCDVNSKNATENHCRAEVSSASGVWIITTVDEERSQIVSNNENLKRKKCKDIDDLFEELDEKLAKNMNKKLKKIKRSLKRREKATSEKTAQDSESEPEPDLSLKKNPQSLRPDEDRELMETSGAPAAVPCAESAAKPALEFRISEKETPPEIDPTKFVQVKTKKLNTKLPDSLAGENDFLDDEENAQRMNIIEAFEGDDVMEEFKEMKKEEEESTKLEMPQELPGWGSWGGTGIKPRSQKRETTTKLPPRKDHKKKDIIISEHANKKVIEHMVKEVPYPFKSVGAYEANVRNPVGREWVPESAHRKFIEKPVETLIGSIIEPMDETELVTLQKSKKSLYRGINKIDKK